MRAITLNVNGKPVGAEVEPRTNLADFLREHLTLTGTHLGCEHGVCGACTVLVDGAPARSCITFAAACEGAEVTTVEGLDDDPLARDLRAAFSAHHGLQCGYCTPGMMVTARDIVQRLPDADDGRIREELSGNLCRCTGYAGIVEAIKSVMAARAGSAEPLPARGLGPVGAGHGAAVREAAVTAAAQPSEPAPAVRMEALSAEQWAAVESQGTKITQSFTVDHPVDEVWRFFADPDAIARCMPGARLTSQSDDGTVEGEVTVKLGPIVAAFAGVAEIERDEAARRGTVRGQGRDRKSASRARGIVTYTLAEAGSGTTRVDVAVTFLIAGTLAQFSRGGLVHDIASQITAAFARNLEARLAGEDGAPDAGALDAGSLARKAFWSRIKAIFRRLFGGSA